MEDFVEDFVEEAAQNDDLFDCEYTSIEAIVNQVIVFTGCQTRQTENGERTLVAYGEGYNRSAFFTNSKKLRDVFANPNRRYPFRAIIKVVNYGSMFGFRVFPPTTEVTQQDKDNFDMYKRTKKRNWRQ